jgi:hypothetical protein
LHVAKQHARSSTLNADKSVRQGVPALVGMKNLPPCLAGTLFAPTGEQRSDEPKMKQNFHSIEGLRGAPTRQQENISKRLASGARVSLSRRSANNDPVVPATQNRITETGAG